jgi:putative hydrolase of the HAD superfamily
MGKAPIKYQAVIFDLFGTLVEKFPLREYQEALMQMAVVVSVPADDFIRLWYDTFDERDLGVFRSIEKNVAYICRQLTIAADGSKIEAAAHINLDFLSKRIKARPEAIETLSTLRSNGYKTGLITNCEATIPGILDEMPLAALLDVSVFSAFSGIHKPDPRIYRLAVERLVVKPEDCLYIGDGDCQELTGAANAGMHPVLIRDLDEDRANVYRVGYEADSWQGPEILSLKEVLDLL